MDDRNKLKKKQILDVKDEEELSKLESLISDACQDENREKVMNNFHDINGDDGNLSHQGVWKLKKKYFPKIKPSLPVGKKNLKGQLIPIQMNLKSCILTLLNIGLDIDQPNLTMRNFWRFKKSSFRRD